METALSCTPHSDHMIHHASHDTPCAHQTLRSHVHSIHNASHDKPYHITCTSHVHHTHIKHSKHHLAPHTHQTHSLEYITCVCNLRTCTLTHMHAHTHTRVLYISNFITSFHARPESNVSCCKKVWSWRSTGVRCRQWKSLLLLKKDWML